MKAKILKKLNVLSKYDKYINDKKITTYHMNNSHFMAIIRSTSNYS